VLSELRQEKKDGTHLERDPEEETKQSESWTLNGQNLIEMYISKSMTKIPKSEIIIAGSNEGTVTVFNGSETSKFVLNQDGKPSD